jgi:hypothetical protein
MVSLAKVRKLNIVTGLESVRGDWKRSRHDYILNETWIVDLVWRNVIAAPINHLKEETSSADEDGLIKDWIGMHLRATADKAEFHDLSNIWCRKVTWGLALIRKDGSLIHEEDDDVETICELTDSLRKYLCHTNQGSRTAKTQGKSRIITVGVGRCISRIRTNIIGINWCHAPSSLEIQK